MNNEKVSIIIPVYNCEKYISKMLKSILTQSYQNIEVIIVNDGSTDNSYEECKKVEDSRIIIISQENKGVSSARNKGIERATGKYITFIDPDDWVEKGYIEYMYNKIKENDVDIVAVGHYIEKDNKIKRAMNFEDKILSSESALDMSSKYFFSAIWAKLFKKEILTTNNIEKLFDEDLFYSEDTLAYCKLLRYSNKIYWTSTPLYYYHINENGAMKKKDIEKYFSDYISRSRIVELVKENEYLFNIANLKKTSSAVNVLLYFKLNNHYDINKEYELRKTIKENKKIYLKSKYIKAKDKFLYLATENVVLYFIYFLKNRKLRK